MFNTDQTEAHQGAFSHASDEAKKNHLIYDHGCLEAPPNMDEFHNHSHLLENVWEPEYLPAHRRDPKHTCHIGPLCERAFAQVHTGEYPDCKHSSCMEMFDELCWTCHDESWDGRGQTDPILCEKHGWTCIIDAGSNSGFAGEGVWWENWACGDGVIDQGHYNDN